MVLRQVGIGVGTGEEQLGSGCVLVPIGFVFPVDFVCRERARKIITEYSLINAVISGVVRDLLQTIQRIIKQVDEELVVCIAFVPIVNIGDGQHGTGDHVITGQQLVFEIGLRRSRDAPSVSALVVQVTKVLVGRHKGIT